MSCCSSNKKHEIDYSIPLNNSHAAYCFGKVNLVAPASRARVKQGHMPICHKAWRPDLGLVHAF